MEEQLKSNNNDICVVIPVHNECRAIGRLVEGICSKNLDVIVIDDGSIDGSGRIAHEKGAHVIYHETKKGKGLSLQEGFAHALEKNYKGIIAMDGDGQHAIEDIDSFLTKAKEFPSSIINGNRMQNAERMPLIRRLTNGIMSWLISLVCKQHIPDTQCGFRYIPVNILKEIEINSNDFEIETEVLIEASRHGYPVASIPIKTIYQNEKSKINPYKDTIRFFAYLMRELFPKR